MYNFISSTNNPIFQKYLSLTTSKGIKKEGLALVSGKKIISEILNNKKIIIEAELTTRGQQSLTEKPRLEFSPELFQELDVLGTHHNLISIQAPPIQPWSPENTLRTEKEIFEVFIPVGDPGNLGAVLRSCEAFGVQAPILTTESAHPFLPKSIKASSGSCFRLRLQAGPSMANIEGPCLALDRDGISISDFIWPQKVKLILGEEGQGLKKLNTEIKKISIPTKGVESLNAVVAASIALFHWNQTRNKK